MLRPYRTGSTGSQTRWIVPDCATPSCGATPSRTDGWSRRATAPVRTCSCGVSPTSPSNTSSTSTNLHNLHQPPHEHPARIRYRGHRRLLPRAGRDRVLGGATGEERQRRLFPRESGCRVVRGGRESVRVEYRQRAPRGPRGYGGGERTRGGPLRMARLLHAAAARLAVRAVLPAERRVHHAGVPPAAVASVPPTGVFPGVQQSRCTTPRIPPS